MKRKSKYATLDARIMAAIKARRKHTLRRIGHDKFVHRELTRVQPWEGEHNEAYRRFWSLVSRRLQSLRERGLIYNTPVFHRWVIPR